MPALVERGEPSSVLAFLAAIAIRAGGGGGGGNAQRYAASALTEARVLGAPE